MSDDRRTAITNDQIETINDPSNRDALSFDSVENKMLWLENISIFPFNLLDCGIISTKSMISYYESSGGTNITNGNTILFDTVTQNSDLYAFSVSSGIITCNISGTYYISYDVSTNATTNYRSTVECRIEKDSGSSFITLNGSKSYTYNRNATSGKDTASCTIMVTLNKNDRIRIYAIRTSGSANMVTLANASRLSIFSTSINNCSTVFQYDCGDIADLNNITENKLDCGGI